MESLSGKPDLDARPEYYHPVNQHLPDILAGGISPDKLSSSTQNKQKLAKFLEQHGKTAADYAFLPLAGKEDDVLWAWDRASSKPVGVIAINPWLLGQVAAAK
jgi:isocitrate lyase